MTDSPVFVANVTLPNCVGYWLLNDSFIIPVTKKRNRFHRFMTTLLLGWEWKEND